MFFFDSLSVSGFFMILVKFVFFCQIFLSEGHFWNFEMMGNRQSQKKNKCCKNSPILTKNDKTWKKFRIRKLWKKPKTISVSALKWAKKWSFNEMKLRRHDRKITFLTIFSILPWLWPIFWGKVNFHQNLGSKVNYVYLSEVWMRISFWIYQNNRNLYYFTIIKYIYS